MNPELLRTIHVSMEIVYPPINNLDKSILTSLYADISRRYEYDSFNLLPNGAQMTNNTGSLLRVSGDRISFQEDNLQADIQIYKEKFFDILEMMKKLVPMPAYLFQIVILRALWPQSPGENSRDYLMNRFFQFSPDDLGRLGRPVAGSGLRVNMPSSDEVFDLKIEPWFRDVSQMFVELRGEYPVPVNDLQVLQDRIDKVYTFLFQNVSSFVSNKS